MAFENKANMIPKIISAEEREKKSKRLNTFMVIFMIVILGGSTAAYALFETEGSSKKKFDDFTFLQTANGWNLKKTGLYFSYVPQDVENISSKGTFEIENFRDNVYIVAQGTTELLAANELIQNIGPKKATLACLPDQENETLCIDLPLKSCDSAEYGNAVVIIKEANETAVTSDNYCLKIEAAREDMMKSADNALYKFFKIL